MPICYTGTPINLFNFESVNITTAIETILINCGKTFTTQRFYEQYLPWIKIWSNNFAIFSLPSYCKLFPWWVHFVCIRLHSCVLLYVYSKATFYVLRGCDLTYFVLFFFHLTAERCVSVFKWMIESYVIDMIWFFKVSLKSESFKRE